MNKEVEQRIVEMQFNNSDFEAKVQKSLETLHKLKDATKLEDAGKGLDNLAKSAKITWATCWIPIAGALAIWLMGVSPILIILLAALGGYVYGALIKPTE